MSQCDRIAAVLADGQWHTVAEIHQRCGFSRLNSRVAELRSRRGMNIECRHVAGKSRGSEAYEYRLVSPLNAPSVLRRADGALSGGRVAVGDLAVSSSASVLDADPRSWMPGELEPCVGAAQLTVWDAIDPVAA